jgi:PAS domain S-box-containing protein
MKEELEFRTRELDQLNSRYAETLERMPWAVMVLDSDGRVQFWNSASQKLFDMQSNSVMGLELSQLPIDPRLRDALVRRRKAMEGRSTPMLLKNQEIRVKRATQKFDVHLTPLSRDSGKPSLLLMFAPHESNGEARNTRAGSTARTKPRKSAPKKGGKRS